MLSALAVMGIFDIAAGYLLIMALTAERCSAACFEARGWGAVADCRALRF